MALREKYSPRKMGTIIDTAHIIIGAAVVLMSIFAVMDPDRYKVLFPLIFLLASVLCWFTAWYELKTGVRLKNNKINGVAYSVLGLIIFVLFVLSAVAIWVNA